MSGILVLADEVPLRSDVPSMHLSDLAAIFRHGEIETYYQQLVTPVPPPLPFAFIESPTLVPGEPTTYKYIAPPEVLLRTDVPTWHFQTSKLPELPNSGSQWLNVTKAEPLDINQLGHASIR